MILVDTNVLLDVLENDPVWAEWSLHQLRAQSQVHDLAINPVIYAELSLAFDSVRALDSAIATLGLIEEALPHPALILAGRAFLKYRRKGGARSNVLPDFFIGAHDAVQDRVILTRDVRRYRSYFPTVTQVAPNPGDER